MRILNFKSNKTCKKLITSIGYLMITGMTLLTFSGCNESTKTTPTTAPIQQEIKKEVQQNESPKIIPETVNSTNPQTTSPLTVNSTPSVTQETKVTPKPVVPEVKTESTPKQTTQSITVYGTRTGKKYHLDGCRSLSKSRIPMNLSDAKASGLTACGVCNPPK